MLSAALPLPAWRRAAPPAGPSRPDAGHLFLAIIVLAAIFAPLLAPHDPFEQDVTARLIPPVWQAQQLGTYPQRQAGPRLSVAPDLRCARLADHRYPPR
jgi:ABC-type dipeptide/oligopeptide/nickel transport system permease subunit